MENDRQTSELKGHRTLATVVFTDCVGFSARMSLNEDHTLDLIRRDLRQMKKLCEQYEGRVLKSTGDGLLMCFISAVKAVEYAIAIQQHLIETAQSLPAADALQHRIGIHLADIFITDTDVMGNGVNIAARLQTLADPGGICVSQTVYDVVKAGLALEVCYLGPQELKNIREVVPTYRIVMHPDGGSDPYAETVRRLEQDRNALRLKKLLIYATHQVWESDQGKLNATNLKDLLQELVRLVPTLDELRSFLDGIVKTLSKPAEYALVAEALLAEVGELYASLSQMPDLPVQQTSAQPLNVYGQLAQELEQTGNLVRIKKLIFYVCKRRWENDPSHLEAVSLPDLLTELHRLAPSFDRLQHLLNQFVQTLSKQAEYALVANAISSRLQVLYTATDIPPTQALSTRPLTQLAGAETPAAAENEFAATYQSIAQELEPEPNLLRIKKLMLFVTRRQWESDLTNLGRLQTQTLVAELHQLAHTYEQLESALGAVVKSLNKQEEYRAIAKTITTRLGRLYPDRSAAPAAIPGGETGDRSPSQAEAAPTPEKAPDSSKEAPGFSLFDSRLGIMKYANPLHSKILIFAALHGGFSDNRQDWLNLKMFELDGLLRQLLHTCKLYTELEALLYKTAHQLDHPEEAVQTATALAKCLRSFYLHGSPAALVEAPVDVTRLSLDVYEETTLEIANASDDDNFTCQLLSSEGKPEVAVKLEDTELSQTHLASEARQTTDRSDSTQLRFNELTNDALSNVQAQTQPSSNQGATN